MCGECNDEEEAVAKVVNKNNLKCKDDVEIKVEWGNEEN